MQDAWMIVGVVLLAVLAGAAVPVLFQLYSTLRTTRSLLTRLGPKIDDTLTEIRETSRRLNRVGSGLEKSTQRAQVLLDAAGDIGESLKGLRDSVRTATAIGKAVGPAVAAAVGALTELRSPDEEAPAATEQGDDQ
jgi:ABC-type transporter Mla subunit MlaD